MEIVYKNPNELIGYENNPRKNEDAINIVAESIHRYGFKVPCLITKNNVIVLGHTRKYAAIKEGLEKIPCFYADDLTESQINEFRIVENKTNEYAEWDYDKLIKELETITGDLSFFGIPNPDEIEVDLDIKDDDFIQNVPMDKGKHKKSIVCPHCSKAFEI